MTTFDLSTLEGAGQSSFGFSFHNNDDTTFAYFFNLVTGLPESTTIDGYTCTLGHVNDYAEADEYFAAMHLTDTQLCNPLVMLPRYPDPPSISLHYDIESQYLQLFFPNVQKFDVPLVFNIVCQASTVLAEVVRGSWTVDAMAFWVNHCSACDAGCA